MAATYGYGGEFSSDEDIDRIEQQSERLNKFDPFAQVKPTKKELEQTIESIRNAPLDQDVDLSDDLIAGILDMYRTQRGPIVDSTRALYKKIILKLVRGEQAANGDAPNNNNNNNNNVNDDNIVKSADMASSDEDEPMPPVIASNPPLVIGKSRAKGLVLSDPEPMEVDSEALGGPMRSKKADVDSESSSDDEDEEDATDEEAADEESESSDSEVLDITPIKSQTATKTNTRSQTSVSRTIPKPAVLSARKLISTPSNQVETGQVRKRSARNLRSNNVSLDEAKPATKESTPQVVSSVVQRPSLFSKTNVVLFIVMIASAILLVYQNYGDLKEFFKRGKFMP